MIELNRGYNADFMEIAAQLPDKSVGLIMSDPPYFEVKGDFDFIWSSFDDYLKDVDRWAAECKRILADNGSLFWFGDRKNIAYSQVILDKYFNLENNIYWQKAEKCQMEMFDTLRSFYCRGFERILFYSNKEEYNLTDCVNHIRDYIRSEILKSKGKIFFKEINGALGTATNGGGVASACLSLDKTKPTMITKGMYEKLQNYCYPYLNKSYEILREEYEKLKIEYELSRRPFNNNEKLSDHWFFTNESNGIDHPTKKPLKMVKTMLQTTTRKDTLVFIPFWGSGTDSEACHELGLDWIACEIDEKHYNTASKRQKEKEKQPLLF